MKKCAFCVIATVSCVALSTLAQEEKKTISDSYAKAALYAVKDLRSNLTSLTSTSAAASGLKDKIDKADVEAVTPEERKNVKELRRLYIDHEINVIYLQAQASYPRRGDVLKDPVVSDILRRETTCFDDYEDALRNRSPEVPKTCESIRPPVSEKKENKSGR